MSSLLLINASKYFGMAALGCIITHQMYKLFKSLNTEQTTIKITNVKNISIEENTKIIVKIANISSLDAFLSKIIFLNFTSNSLRNYLDSEGYSLEGEAHETSIRNNNSATIYQFLTTGTCAIAVGMLLRLEPNISDFQIGLTAVSFIASLATFALSLNQASKLEYVDLANYK